MTNSNPPVQRLRLCYGKKADARYIGHLDVARFWERVFRRLDLPIAYSHGFNPQARMQFASALPLGIDAENELVDVWLTQRVYPAVWLDRIDETLPSGFILNSLTEVALKLPAMQASLRFADYEVDFSSSIRPDELSAQISALMAEQEIIRPHHKKQGKTYDLRPLISDLQVCVSEQGSLLYMRLHSGPQGNGRAAEVIAALDVSELRYHIVRTQLILEEPLLEPAA